MIACRGLRLRQQGFEPDADQRGDVRRASPSAPVGIARYSAGKFGERGGGAQPRHRRSPAPRPDRWRGRARRRTARRPTSPWLSRMAPIAGQRSRIAGIEIDGLAIVLERVRGLARLLLDRGQVAIQKRRIRRCRDRLLINRRGLVPATRIGGRLGAREHVLGRRGIAARRRGCEVGQRRILRQRRLEARQRVGIAIELEQHLAACRSAPAHSRRPPAARDRTASRRPSRCRARAAR